MQVTSEMKIKSSVTHEAAQGSFFRGGGKKAGNTQNLGNSRPRRRNGQKKKPDGKRKLNTMRDNRNLDRPTIPVDQREESGREFRKSPLAGIKKIFQGSPHPRSNAEMPDFSVNQAFTRPATPGPSRKSQGNARRGYEASSECQEIKQQSSLRTATGFSSPNTLERDSRSATSVFSEQALSAVSNEKHHLARDADANMSANRNQKKRRNRRKNKREKSKRDCGLDEMTPRQFSPAQPDAQEARQNCPSSNNELQTGLPLMKKRPPPIPMINFDVKPHYGPEEESPSVSTLGLDVVPKMDGKSPRKDNAEKSFFPKTGQVMRILQNKNRGMDTGCTHAGSQKLQKSAPEVLPAPKQLQRTKTVENMRLDPRSLPFYGTGRNQGEVLELYENRTVVGKRFQNECQGPSPGASSPPLRMSSQDVRNNDVTTPRIRRTPRKPSRKPFQKNRGK